MSQEIRHSFVTIPTSFRNVSFLFCQPITGSKPPHMKPKLLQGAVLSAGVVTSALLSATGAQAQSADALLDKLVEKGVLSTKEAKELREQADHNFTTAYQVKSGMPDWVTAFKIN